MALAAISFGAIAKTPVYLDRTAPIEARVEEGYGRAVIDSNIPAGTFYFEYYLVVGGRAEVAVLVDYFCCEIAQVFAVG